MTRERGMTREALLKRMRPLIDDFAGALATLLAARFGAARHRALELAKQHLAKELDADDAERESDRAARGPAPRKARIATRVTGRTPQRCKVCGEPGHNARRHANGKSAAATSELALATLSPPPSRAGRFAAIEAAAAARRNGRPGTGADRRGGSP